MVITWQNLVNRVERLGAVWAQTPPGWQAVVPNEFFPTVPSEFPAMFVPLIKVIDAIIQYQLVTLATVQQPGAIMQLGATPQMQSATMQQLSSALITHLAPPPPTVYAGMQPTLPILDPPEQQALMGHSQSLTGFASYLGAQILQAVPAGIAQQLHSKLSLHRQYLLGLARGYDPTAVFSAYTPTLGFYSSGPSFTAGAKILDTGLAPAYPPPPILPYTPPGAPQAPGAYPLPQPQYPGMPPPNYPPQPPPGTLPYTNYIPSYPGYAPPAPGAFPPPQYHPGMPQAPQQQTPALPSVNIDPAAAMAYAKQFADAARGVINPQDVNEYAKQALQLARDTGFNPAEYVNKDTINQIAKMAKQVDTGSTVTNFALRRVVDAFSNTAKKNLPANSDVTTTTRTVSYSTPSQLPTQPAARQPKERPVPAPAAGGPILDAAAIEKGKKRAAAKATKDAEEKIRAAEAAAAQAKLALETKQKADAAKAEQIRLQREAAKDKKKEKKEAAKQKQQAAKVPAGPPAVPAGPPAVPAGAPPVSARAARKAAAAASVQPVPAAAASVQPAPSPVTGRAARKAAAAEKAAAGAGKEQPQEQPQSGKKKK